MIKIAIPGMYEHRIFNDLFLDIKNTKKEWFYEDTEVCAVYGNPQFCIWDGGRIFPKYEMANREEISKTIEIYNNKYNIPIRYVFTNNQLKETDYYNKFGNVLLNLGNNSENEIVISDNNFRDFLKEKWNYKFISSTTKCLNTEKLAKEELNDDNFSLVCLDYNLNRKINFLSSLNEEEKEKVELLVNPICKLGCQYRKEHYRLNSIHNLQFGKKYGMEECNIVNSLGLFESHHILRKDIEDIYVPIGINTFKIEGRTWDITKLAIVYGEYFVKPEFMREYLYVILREVEELRNENLIH